MKKTVNEIIEIAQSKVSCDSFPSKAAQKDAIDGLNRAYYKLQNLKSYAGLEDNGYKVWDIPFGLHQIRQKHKPMIEAAGISWDKVNELVVMRNAFKNMLVVKPEPKPKAEPKGNQATHVGTCQICLRAHKVNNQTGKIAAHGYKMVGYQEGECEGSNELPLQNSVDALVKIISSFKNQVENYKDQIAAGEEFKTFYFRDKPPRQIPIQKIINTLMSNSRLFQDRIDCWKPTELKKVGA